jgi:Astacin (Peptidase family M12A)
VSQLPGRSYEAYARLPFQKNMTRVKYRVSSTGEAVFEGDMILGDAQEVQRWSDQYERLGPTMAVSLVDSAFLWPGGVVPYRISDEFKNKTVTAIKDAVNELNSKTNVRLIPYDKKAHKDYVDILVMKEEELGGGQSEIGRQGKRQTHL